MTVFEMIDIRNTIDGVLDIKCSSEFEHLDTIVDRSEEFLASLIEDEELAYKVVLLLSEAVTNAIEHGNKLDASKHVTISLEVKPKKVTITVEDQGEGFDRGQLKDPIDGANLLNDGGRGIFFIQEMADAYHLENGGRRVHIIFNR